MNSRVGKAFIFILGILLFGMFFIEFGGITGSAVYSQPAQIGAIIVFALGIILLALVAYFFQKLRKQKPVFEKNKDDYEKFVRHIRAHLKELER